MSDIGFACLWDRVPERTWSGSPFRLRSALEKQCSVVDVGVQLAPVLELALKAGHARRRDGRWVSMWKHGTVARHLVGQRVRRAVVTGAPAAVLMMQDLTVPTAPTYMVQDLTYGTLLRRWGPQGVEHFAGLSRRRAEALRDRQLEVAAGVAGLFPMSRWAADQMTADGVDPKKLHVVHPGMNTPPLGDALPDRRRGAPRLLFIGRDFTTKGGDQVVAAFDLVRRERGPESELVVAGPSTWPTAGPVPDGVRFMGPVSRDTVSRLLDSADLFVMPSRFEGFGIVFAEALARGLPCIARADCAMPEIVIPGTGGALVHSEKPEDLAELILAALADDELYGRCAADSARVREYYTWDRAAREMLDIIWSEV